MRRLGIAARLALIVAIALVLVQFIALAVQASRDEGFTLGVRASFAREVAGLVALFDSLPTADRDLALRGANAGRIGIQILPGAPGADDSGPILREVTSAVERRLAQEGLPPDRVAVDYARTLPDETTRRGPLARLVGRHLRITVQLAGGGYLVIDPSSEVDAFIFGSLLGLAAGIAGLAILVLAVVAVFRETRPLKALAANLEDFGRSATPAPLAETGARELRSLIRATNQMQAEIAALIRNRALILAGMSHDLRTQVTRLRLRLELLPPGEARERAIGDVEAMQALVEETLSYAEAEGRDVPGQCDVVALLDAMAAAGTPHFAWPGAPAPVRLMIGETSLRRVLENLIGNAIAYGGEASITLAVAAPIARIAVADRGPGIPSGERARIFEPFHRLDASRSRAHGGTGLGLAIVKQILDRHAGRITVADRPGGGCVFMVELPLLAT